MCDGETASVFTQTPRKSRKTRACCECSRPIEPGEMYEQYKGCWAGRWGAYITCAPCVEVRQQLMESTDHGCFTFGELQENLAYER